MKWVNDILARFLEWSFQRQANKLFEKGRNSAKTK